jgi:hypothetical protein
MGDHGPGAAAGCWGGGASRAVPGAVMHVTGRAGAPRHVHCRAAGTREV